MDCLLVACSRGELVGAGPSFEDHVATMTERKALQEVADKLQNEADELEGLVTWFCIQLEDPNTNPQIHMLRNEVTKKRRGVVYIYILQKASINDYICTAYSRKVRLTV